jgi:hypothetical protein
MMAKVGSVPRPGPEEDVEPSKLGDQVVGFFLCNEVLTLPEFPQ